MTSVLNIQYILVSKIYTNFANAVQQNCVNTVVIMEAI
ncbi:hypothetical protein APHCRT_0716 [Anaplasma phagocytophilum str. CRT53-1]|nr:hypothetical protein APHWEB_1425 [Anaplasma phagocytophilum str. Webster]KJV82271.1 hypothetical protein APHHGE2_0883 [Anaplasma phagocytophilum str. HGE2]KJV84544.1 hypothetical protein APHWI1_0086 [Anaplasma phagocytophilum str. ApWI1]KJV86124.1 hypothetical protein APHCRT_0716 [Anaplasma phagocytophilum str. CRT53-1]KJV87612.1 hypothetical protein APHNYW_0614 [Anaplasma phagocytophilum str. ApNYW]KJV98969.1 hypothetical protein OTSANNIE_0853 [Anaplasma phagocytophilum str. Annie]KJZ9798